MGLPSFIKFIPELLSAAVALYVIVVGPQQKFRLVQPKYWIAFGALTFIVVCGIAVNGVDTGPTVAGIRSYLRAIPFFFLPAVFSFTERQIKLQLVLLLLLTLAQSPFAGYQRWIVMSEGRFTGDEVIGTLETTASLTIFSISAVAVLMGLLLRDRIGKLPFMVLFLVMLIPTMINETKVTVVLLPLALLVTLVVGSPSGRRLRAIGGAAALLVIFGAIFIPIYDLMQENNPYPQEISLGLLTDPKKNYLESETAGIGATNYVGRMDALTIPVQFLSKDIVQMAFGVGIGNASVSALGSKFTGEYGKLFDYVAISDLSLFLLEVGFIGVGCVFILFWLVFGDAVAVARRDQSISGAIAVGWAGVVVLMAVSTIYTLGHNFASLSFLYWYFAGLMASRHVQLLTPNLANGLYRVQQIGGPSSSDRRLQRGILTR